MSNQLTLKQQLTQPVISDLLSQRIIGWATLGAAGLHFGLIAAGLPGWGCPFRHTLGIPCPGCGLSRAVHALWHGDWSTSLNYHAFALPVLVFLLLIISASLLPGVPRSWLLAQTARVERRWAVTGMGMTILFGYWLVRLTFFNESYFALIMN